MIRSGLDSPNCRPLLIQVKPLRLRQVSSSRALLRIQVSPSLHMLNSRSLIPLVQGLAQRHPSNLRPQVASILLLHCMARL